MIEPLELREYNPYSTGKVIEFDDGTVELDIGTFDLTGNQNDEYYIAQKGDRLDKIAYDRYNNQVADPSKYWWVIAIANDIENALDETEFVGKELRIPNLLNFKIRN